MQQSYHTNWRLDSELMAITHVVFGTVALNSCLCKCDDTYTPAHGREHLPSKVAITDYDIYCLTLCISHTWSECEHGPAEIPFIQCVRSMCVRVLKFVFVRTGPAVSNENNGSKWASVRWEYASIYQLHLSPRHLKIDTENCDSFEENRSRFFQYFLWTNESSGVGKAKRIK